MKKLVLIALVISTLASCGKSNKVNSGEISGTDPLKGPMANFTGDYKAFSISSNDCAYTIRIVQDCNGYKLFNGNGLGVQEFCNVNLGATRGPDNSFNDSLVVTQKGSQLQSTLTMGQRTFTHTLTIDVNGKLTKVENLKSRETRCIYERDLTNVR
ncbi:MAG: hypothetical protein K2Q18_16435 [Bdellovibrionales bacterium]|nr:hypothetical protein [Bdellovibrionales bacterium]